MQTLGFLGTGIMGTAMAHRLLDAGYELRVWNRTPSKLKPLLDKGARAENTPREVAEHSGITLAMLADPEAAHSVFFGEDGVCQAMAPEKSYIDLSTVDPHTPQQIAEAVEDKGGRFLEAPVSGSKKPAEDGTLVVLAGGNSKLYSEAEKIFSVIAKKSFYLGEAGRGAQMKLVVNMVMGSMMTAFSEGLALAEESGLDPEQLIDVLQNGALANPMFQIKGPNMLKEDYTVNFPLKHMQKDMRLAVALGDESGQPLFAAASANEQFKRALAAGSGDLDFSAVHQIVRGRDRRSS